MDNLRLFWNFYVLRQGVIAEGRIQAHRIETITVYRGRGGSYEKTVYTLEYSFDYNETNYLQSNAVSLRTYDMFKDGDRVKVRFSPRDPTISRIEEA